MAPVPTLRRLNDRERYWGLTWPQWIAAALAGGVLYAAVKLSPFGVKATVTIVLLALALATMVLLGVSGQALSPVRQLQAITRYRRSPKQWALPERPDKRGLVLANAPTLYQQLLADADEQASDPLLDEWNGPDDEKPQELRVESTEEVGQ